MRWFRPKIAFPTDCRWTVLSGSNDGKPLLIRKNVTAADLQKSRDFTNRVGIAVPLLSPDENGLPGNEELQTLNLLEDAVSGGLGREQQGIHVLTITTSGFREHVSYVTSQFAVAALVSELQSKFPQYNIQHYIAKDPKWATYSEFA